MAWLHFLLWHNHIFDLLHFNRLSDWLLLLCSCCRFRLSDIRRLLLSWLRGEILDYGSLTGVRHQMGFQSLIVKGLRLSDYLIKVGRSRCNHLLLELLVTRRVHCLERVFRED